MDLKEESRSLRSEQWHLLSLNNEEKADNLLPPKKRVNGASGICDTVTEDPTFLLLSPRREERELGVGKVFKEIGPKASQIWRHAQTCSFRSQPDPSKRNTKESMPRHVITELLKSGRQWKTVKSNQGEGKAHNSDFSAETRGAGRSWPGIIICGRETAVACECCVWHDCQERMEK